MHSQKIDKIIDRTNESYKKRRAKYLKFFVSFLDKLGFTPNSLGFLRAISGFVFFLLVNINFVIAFIILILGGLTDFLDGVLARFQKKDSDRGKFIDMLCDNIIFSFFLLGLIKINFANILSIAYFIFIIPALYLIIIVNKNEYQKNDWIIKPYSRISYYKIIFEVVFLATIIFSLNKSYINSTLLLLNVVMSVHFSYHFYLFLEKKQK